MLSLEYDSLPGPGHQYSKSTAPAVLRMWKKADGEETRSLDCSSGVPQYRLMDVGDFPLEQDGRID